MANTETTAPPDRPPEVPVAVAAHAHTLSLIAGRAQAITIVDDASLASARDFLVDVKQTWTNIEADRVTIKKPLDEAVLRVQTFFRKLLTPLEHAEQIVKPKIAGYLAEQERKRVEEERRLRAEADRIRREEEEKARQIAAQADAERAAAEQRARDASAEAERQERIRAAAEQTGNTAAAERAAALAAELVASASSALAQGEQKAQGLAEQAAARSEAAAMIATPSLERTAAPAGTSLRWKYGAECTDLKALCLAIGQGKAPITLVKFEQGVADRMASTMKDSFEGAYPGVRMTKAPNISQRK